MFDGATVLITGGTGSFGRAFTEYLLSETACRAVRIFSRDEFKQHEMQTALDRQHRSGRVRFLLGDVRDHARLHLACLGVDYLVHAAALKQVPALEYNPTEAVKTNITGAINVIHAALGCGVEKVVALSTDKACAPVTLYGGTKFVAEKLFQDANVYAGPNPRPRFAVTRYGNVMGSRGSVLPLWRQAIAEGRQIGVTEPDMTRFWMVLPEAVALVVKAFQKMQGGEVFIPKLPSFYITDLARALGAATWDVIGKRAAEKTHEQLIAPDEVAEDHGDTYILRPEPDTAKVRPGFVYASNVNERWLDAEGLKTRLQSV